MTVKNKLVIVALILAVLLLAVLIALGNRFSPENEEASPTNITNIEAGGNILFYTPDYNKNIYNDENYMALIDSYALEFSDGDSSYKVPKAQLEKYGGSLALFFYSYFTDIRNGDVDAYKSHFHEKADSVADKVTDFTMQQIYDISIKVLDIIPTLDSADYGWIESGKLEPVFVDVRYKIRENNGTFRYDIGSDTVKPQLYMLLEDKNTYKIVNIIDYEPIYS